MASSAISSAHAQVVLSGQWRSGATAIDVQVESWGTDCGPPPKSSQSAGGGLVRVVQLGDQLQLHSGGRVIRSDVCFGQNPGLKRIAKTVKDNTWVTRCETPTDDPRAETGVYTLKLLSPERLLYQDVSRFRWQLKTSLCVATITTIQTLTRLSDEEAAKADRAPPVVAQQTAPAPAPKPGKKGAAPPPPPKLPELPAQKSVITMLGTQTAKPAAQPPAPPPPPAPVPATKPVKAPCVPGDAARLALAPRRRTIELGNRFCFRTRVVDRAGCALPPIAPTWALEAGPALRAKLDPHGCFEASAQAADGEGTFHVTASVTTPKGGTLRTQAVVEVVTADLSALVAKRLFDDDAGAGDLEAELAAQAAEPPPVEPPAATSHTATRAVGTAEAPATRPPWMWPAIAGVLALLGGAIALVARRRTRTSMVPEADLPAAGLPTIRTSDREAKPSDPVTTAAPKPAKPSTDLRCPKCGTVYPAGSAFCGTDGTPLKP